MHLATEARNIAAQALEEANGDHDLARDYVHQICEGHSVSIYYGQAIQFCAEQDTDDGEAWLEDCGGIALPGDSFGTIACRIAFATLLVAAERALHELQEDAAEAA